MEAWLMEQVFQALVLDLFVYTSAHLLGAYLTIRFINSYISWGRSSF
jgi:hypothetical protein